MKTKDAAVPTSAPATYTAMKRPLPLTTSRWGPMVWRAWLLTWQGGEGTRQGGWWGVVSRGVEAWD